MVAAQGSGPDPTLLDALTGPGGMADPIGPVYLGVALVGDVFPDALSASPMPFAVVAAAPSAPVGPPVAPRQIRSAAPATRRSPPSPRPGTPGPVRPWSQFPPPGQPSVQYVPVPTSAQLTPASGRRPTAGTGPPAAVRTDSAAGRNVPGVVRSVPAVGPGAARPGTAVRPGTPARPPAYLPQPGMTQVRAALRQARRGATRRNTGQKKSGIWGSLVFLALLLIPSGLGHRIISAISDLLQRR